MTKIGFNKNFNITRVVRKLVIVLLALYVGGTIMNAIGDVLLNTTPSSFYQGFNLIGWTVETNTQTNGTAGFYKGCGLVSGTYTPTAQTNCITDVSGAGVLAVVGIIGIARIILEFVSFR